MCRCRGALYVLVPVTSKTEDARIQIQKPEKLTAQGQLLEALYIHPSILYVFFIFDTDGLLFWSAAEGNRKGHLYCLGAC